MHVSKFLMSVLCRNTFCVRAVSAKVAGAPIGFQPGGARVTWRKLRVIVRSPIVFGYAPVALHFLKFVQHARGRPLFE